MRVAFFVNVFPPRHESFILNQAVGLLKRGIDLEVIARRRGAQDKTLIVSGNKDLVPRIRYCPAVPRNRLSRYVRGIGWAAGNTKLAAVAGKQLFAFGARRTSAHPSSLRLLCDSVPFRAYNEYGIVHCQYGPLGASAVRLREVGVFDAPIVTSFRGTDLTREIKRNPSTYRELFEKGDLFLPVSEDFRQRLIDLGCPSNKIHVLRSGINTTEFYYRARSLNPGETLRLLSVGRLVEKKGFEFAIRAVAKLRGAIKGIRNQLPERPGTDRRLVGCFAQLVPDPFNCPSPFSYTIVGDGPLRPQLEELAASLGVGDIVKFRGWQPQDNVLEELSRAHIVINSSVTAANGDEEGIPNTLKEAMACGIPVIATRHSGIPELVEDEVSGYLVPERDSDAIADRIERMVCQAGQWPEMGEAGHKMIADHYDTNCLNDRLVRLYQELVSREDENHNNPSERSVAPPQVTVHAHK